eukprot:Em0723g2a
MLPPRFRSTTYAPLMEKIHKTQGTDKKKKILSSFIERVAEETHARLHASHRRGHDGSYHGADVDGEWTHSKVPQRLCCAVQELQAFLELVLASCGFWSAAEWHFFATSHGKSAGDGAGGTLKRLATKASLQHAYKDHILTAHQLYQFAVNSIKVPANTVEVKLFSCSTVSRREKQSVAMSPWLMMENPGLVVLLGLMSLNMPSLSSSYTPASQAPCFVFPEQEDLLDIDLSDVLTCVNATTATGSNIYSEQKGDAEASVALRARFA